MKAVNAKFIESRGVIEAIFENGVIAEYDITSADDRKFFNDEVKSNHALLSPFQSLFLDL